MFFFNLFAVYGYAADESEIVEVSLVCHSASTLSGNYLTNEFGHPNGPIVIVGSKITLEKSKSPRDDARNCHSKYSHLKESLWHDGEDYIYPEDDFASKCEGWHEKRHNVTDREYAILGDKSTHVCSDGSYHLNDDMDLIRKIEEALDFASAKSYL